MIKTAEDQIVDEVTSWDGVTAGPGQRGELSIRYGKHEIGHLHGSRTAHFGFPKSIGAGLRAAGRIGPHPVAPDNPGWGARPLGNEEDVFDVIALMRLNYDRWVEREGGSRRVVEDDAEGGA